jgi:zinc transport system substrate-binding protein
MIKKTHLTKVIHYNILLKIVTFLSLLTVQAVLAAPEVAKPFSTKPFSTKPFSTKPFITKPLIITTIKPLAIIAQSAVGDQARVEYLQSAVQSAHTVSLPVSALKKIDQADLIIWIGEMFESRVAKPMTLLSADKRITVMELPLIAPADADYKRPADNHSEHSHGHEPSAHKEPLAYKEPSAYKKPSAHKEHSSNSDQHGLNFDPHVWLNPANANLIAAEIQQRLQLPRKAIISAEQIADLAAELAPLGDKQFLVHHDALDHFTSSFKLQPGLSIRDASGASQGVRSQYRLRQDAIASKASCIFIEPQYADRDAQVIAEELSLPVAVIDIQGLDQSLDQSLDQVRDQLRVGDAYASFMQTLAMQFKSCFNGL